MVSIKRRLFASARRTSGLDRMIKIAITVEAFDAIAATLPLGGVGYLPGEIVESLPTRT